MLDCLADHAQEVLQADECCVTPASTVIVMHAMQGPDG